MNLVAHKAIIAARADCAGAGGDIGRRLAKEVSVVIEKWEKSSKRRIVEGSKDIPEDVSINVRNVKLKVVKKLLLLKVTKRSRRGVLSKETEASLAVALEGIEIGGKEC